MKIRMLRKIPLSLVLGFVLLLFFLPGGVFANSLADENDPVVKEGSSQDFIYDISDQLFAQTSEITIRLEKKYPPEEKTAQPPDAGSGEKSPSAEENGGGVGTESMGQTASSALQPSESEGFYEDLEDPFAKPFEKELPELKDPFEKYNRFMFGVNENIYDYFMEPVARGWRYVLPEDVRIVIKNVFDNALTPVKLFSSLAQGNLDKSGRVLSRVVINTTVGFGGMLDVAGQEYGIENVNEDMDQALGYHDVPTGPYIVLPFLGPSTVRNVAGRTIDSFLSPNVLFSPSFLVGAGVTVSDNVNAVSFIIEDKKALEESAVDEYESVRDFYHQYRQGLLHK